MNSLYSPDLARAVGTLPSRTQKDLESQMALRDDSFVNYSVARVNSTMNPQLDPTKYSISSSNGVESSNLKKVSLTLPSIPTRRNVKPHLPFQRRICSETDRPKSSLHQPILTALPTYIPREERKKLREKLLSEVTSQHDTYKAKHGGGCIVVDASLKINGSSFLSLWRSVENNTTNSSSAAAIGTCRRSAHVLGDLKNLEKYRRLDSFSPLSQNTQSCPRSQSNVDHIRGGKGLFAC